LQPLFFGWKTGLEPATFGTTIRRSNRLNYIHRFVECKIIPKNPLLKIPTLFSSGIPHIIIFVSVFGKRTGHQRNFPAKKLLWFH
jgi:hypothetical protein